MKPLLILTDKDIFEDAEELGSLLETRIAVRIIIFDDSNKIALVGLVAHMLPGGGVEENETLEEAAHRECLEEVGCKIKILEYVGFTEDSRMKRNRAQITHCFVARVIGEKGEPHTKQEDEVDMMLEWHNVNDALTLLKDGMKKYSKKHYQFSFNVRAHMAFLEEYIRKLKNN